MNLTTITEAFGLLDDRARAALRRAHEAGAGVEVFNGDGWVDAGTIDDDRHGPWQNAATYRAKPAPPRIDWSQVDERFWELEQDDAGYAYIYSDVPTRNPAPAAVQREREHVRADAFSSFIPATDESRTWVIHRPGREPSRIAEAS